ncbi:MAG: ABC transporter permease [Oscillospiraceae bacterium]|nr:ABC transporter permease [Oscillospiraceae bacterium]
MFPYILCIVMFSIIPISTIVYYGFTSSEGFFTFENILNIGIYSGVFLRSFLFALASTIFCFLIGYPVAFTISRLKEKIQNILIMVTILPMWINFLLTTYSIMTLLETNGVLSKIFGLLKFPEVSFLNTPSAIIFGMVYNSIPYMIIPIHLSLSKIDPEIIQAAKDLGARQFTIFTKIIFPLSMPGIISGFAMVFGPSMSSFVVSKMLGGNSNLLIGELIELRFLGSTYDPHSSSALALALMAFIMLFTGIINKAEKNNENANISL